MFAAIALSLIGLGVGATDSNSIVVRIDGKETPVILAGVSGGSERGTAFLQCLMAGRVVHVAGSLGAATATLRDATCVAAPGGQPPDHLLPAESAAIHAAYRRHVQPADGQDGLESVARTAGEARTARHRGDRAPRHRADADDDVPAAAAALVGQTKIRSSFSSRRRSRISAAFSKSRFFAASFISFVRREMLLSISSPAARSSGRLLGPPGTSRWSRL